jgi:hypothetical protein
MRASNLWACSARKASLPSPRHFSWSWATKTADKTPTTDAANARIGHADFIAPRHRRRNGGKQVPPSAFSLDTGTLDPSGRRGASAAPRVLLVTCSPRVRNRPAASARVVSESAAMIERARALHRGRRRPEEPQRRLPSFVALHHRRDVGSRVQCRDGRRSRRAQLITRHLPVGWIAGRRQRQPDCDRDPHPAHRTTLF